MLLYTQVLAPLVLERRERTEVAERKGLYLCLDNFIVSEEKLLLTQEPFGNKIVMDSSYLPAKLFPLISILGELNYYDE